MNITEAMGRFTMAIRAVQVEHPELSVITGQALASANRIAARFQIDHDEPRADHELAALLLDVADAAQKQVAFAGNLPSGVNGPPSLADLEVVRARHRASMGIAGTRQIDLGPEASSGFRGRMPTYGARGIGDQTFLGTELGAAVSAQAQQFVQTTVVPANTPFGRFMQWLISVFGGPDIDVNLPAPVGQVVISPFGNGNPEQAAFVAFVAGGVAWIALVATYRYLTRESRRVA